MNNDKTCGFSTPKPNCICCIPSCWVRESPHSCKMCEAWLSGLPISLPATRLIVQISVVAGMVKRRQDRLDNIVRRCSDARFAKSSQSIQSKQLENSSDERIASTRARRGSRSDFTLPLDLLTRKDFQSAGADSEGHHCGLH